MVCACIDIGTNTTRLLVAEPGRDGLREVLAQRVFTRVRDAQGADGTIAAEKLAEVVGVVAAQARAARGLGCAVVHAVATAAIRDAPNRGDLVAAVRRVAHVELEVLTPEEEARLAFCGATRTLRDGGAVDRAIGVVDLGGGSTELVVGTARDGVSWWASVPVGSGTLVDAHLRADPLTLAELDAMRAQAADAFARVDAPSPALALAVGGSATSLRRLCGARLDPASLRAALDLLTRAPAAEVARTHDLDVERVRLLPGALAVLERASAAFAAPLTVARGGLREGILLEAIDEARGGRGA
jgi:exopolyphosphatase/guanosine-5'-triphosphate,3'-diphosphate pyrophosphatase